MNTAVQLDSDAITRTEQSTTTAPQDDAMEEDNPFSGDEAPEVIARYQYIRGI